MAHGGVTVYLPRDLHARIRRIAADQHRSESGIVTDAVKARYERHESHSKALEENARRQIARVDMRLSKAISETLIVKEIVLLFVRVWLEHNPPVSAAHEAAAAASAEARFERFLGLVAQALAPDRSPARPGAHDSAAEPFSGPLTEEAGR